MAGHTKGPWHVNYDRPDDEHSQLSISNGDARIIANVVTYVRTHGLDGGLANARLMAAAPDLLAALQNAAGLLDTPVARRWHLGDEFYGDVVSSIRTALHLAKHGAA